MSTVAFYTLGCKLNFAESSAIGQQMSKAGFEKKEFQDGADLYVIIPKTPKPLLRLSSIKIKMIHS